MSRASRKRARRGAGCERLEGRTLLSTGPVDVQFARVFEGTGALGQSLAAATDAEGQVYLGGTFTGTLDFDPGPGVQERSSGPGPEDGFLARYSPQGVLQWVQTFSVNDGEQFLLRDLAVGPAGEVVAVGSSSTGVDLDPGPNQAPSPSTGGFVLTLNAQGAFASAQRFVASTGTVPQVETTSVLVDPTGSILVAGRLRQQGSVDLDPGPGTFDVAGNNDSFLVWLNADRSFAGAQALVSEEGGEVIIGDLAAGPGDSGDLYLVGSFRGFVDFDPGAGSQRIGSTPLAPTGEERLFTDGFVLRLSRQGQFQGVQAVGGPSIDLFNSVELIASGGAVSGVVVTGPFTGGATLGTISLPGQGTTANLDIVVARYTPDLASTPTWAQLLGNPSDNVPTDVAVDANGRVTVGGTFFGAIDLDPTAGSQPVTSVGGSVDGFLTTLDANGGFVNCLQVGGEGDEAFSQLLVHRPDVVTLLGTYQGASSVGGVALPPNDTGQPRLFFSRVSFAGDILGPAIDLLGPVDPAFRQVPVASVDVIFTESINPTTFDLGDVSLLRDGFPVSTNGVSIAPVAGNDRAYRISGLESATAADGTYVLRVDVTDIADPVGNFGLSSQEVRFVVDTVAPQITAPIVVDPASRDRPVASVDVVFNEPIVPASLLGAVQLSRDGAAVDLSGATVAEVPGSPNRYRISGLADATRLAGSYTLTVDASLVRDLAGNPGVGTGSSQFTMTVNADPGDPGTPGDPNPTDEPRTLIGDYDGDGVADLALYRHDAARRVGVFALRLSNNGSVVETTREIPDVDSNVIPVAGDFDGDRRTDVAVVDPEFDFNGDGGADFSRWIIRQTSDNQIVTTDFGAAGRLDRPAPADFDGDGRTDIATYRGTSDLTPGAAEWFILPSGGGSAFRVAFGAGGGADLPAPFDFDGDGRAEIATFRPIPTAADLGAFPDASGSAQWFILPSRLNDVQFTAKLGGFRVAFGAASNADQPAVADFNGDGREDITAFRSVTDTPPFRWFVLPSSGSFPGLTSGFPVAFGGDGSIAAVAHYVGDSRPDLTVYNPANGTWSIRDGVQGGEQSIAFNPLGAGAVPVLSPLFFRLQATGNIPAQSSGGLASAAQRAGQGLTVSEHVDASGAGRSLRDELVDEAIESLLDGPDPVA